MSVAQPGTSPGGSLVYTGTATEPTLLRLIEYDDQGWNAREIGTDEDLTALAARDGITWINVDGLRDADVIGSIGKAFDLHALVLEDIVHIGQRPKIEEHESYIYVTLRMLNTEDGSFQLSNEQLSLVLGEGWVLTFQEQRGDVFQPVRERLKKDGSRIRRSGSDYLAYALIDALIDRYFVILERLGDQMEALEVEVLDRPTQEAMRDVHRLKQEMLVVRKAVWPLRELASSLVRSEAALIADSTRPFLRDLYDHTIQIIDTAETLRDVVSGLMDLYLSSVSNRMNEVMKVLTIMASIFIPITFLAGVYGMNFDVMPELHVPWAYPVALAVMAAVAGGMLWYFWRRGWL